MSSFIFVLLAGLIGLATVVQAGLNQKVGESLDLNTAILINSIVVLGASVLVYAVGLLSPQFLPNALQVQGFDLSKISQLGWKVLIPGLCGFTIVFGIPWALTKMPALKVFIVIIVAQIVFSILWDSMISHQEISLWRLSGALIALVGVVIALSF